MKKLDTLHFSIPFKKTHIKFFLAGNCWPFKLYKYSFRGGEVQVVTFWRLAISYEK